MERKSNQIWVTIAVLLSVFALISLVSTLLYISHRPMLYDSIGILVWVSPIVNGLAFLFALIYLLAGYNKENAIWYKLFVIVFCISLLMSLESILKLLVVRPVLTRFIVADYAVILGLVMTVAIAKNLGKKTAMTLTGISMALPLCLSIAIAIIFIGDTALNVTLAAGLFRCFILAFVLFVATKSKYVDKDIRGTV